MASGIWISFKLSSKAFQSPKAIFSIFIVWRFDASLLLCHRVRNSLCSLHGKTRFATRLTKPQVRLTCLALPCNASFQWSKEHTHSMVRAIIGSGWQESLWCAAAAALSAASLVVSHLPRRLVVAGAVFAAFWREGATDVRRLCHPGILWVPFCNDSWE